MGEGNLQRVFVSYSRHDLEIITQLIQDIEAVGFETWYDQTLTGGQRWWDTILANIRGCDIFVSALSAASWDSEACRSELHYAVQLGKTIVPVLVADGINVNLLPSPLHEIQVTDYRKRDKEAAFALLRCLHTAGAISPLPDPLPAPPPVPVSYLSNLTERIDSREPLSAQEQITLLFELEQALRDGRSPIEIRDLLLRLKRRDDLLAKVAVNIDTALRKVEENSRGRSASDVFGNSAGTAREGSQVGTKPEDISSSSRRFCQQCGASVGADARFCQSCGGSLKDDSAMKTPAPIGQAPVQSVARSKIRRYTCKSGDSTRIINDVESWLCSQGFDCQHMPTENDGVLVQVRKRGAWRDLVGMATSLNIVFKHSADTLTVEIGAGKWIDKAAAGAVSLVLLWPLAITAGIGAWEQSKTPEKIFDYIGARLAYR